MVTFYNVDYDAVYEVDTSALDTVPVYRSGDMAQASSSEEMTICNNVTALKGAELAGGHLFYLKDGQSVTIKNVHRYIELGVKTFSAEAFDTMYRVTRTPKLYRGNYEIFSSLSGPELETLVGNDDIKIVSDIDLIGPRR
jgi:hypothetical protein